MKEPEIIFENDDVLVVNKPAGLSVHGIGIDAAGTLVEWFLRRVPSAKDVGEPRIGTNTEELERSGVVHRLDRDTSGVMVLAKNQEAFEYIKEQFKERAVKKEYRALVYGLMKERWGTVDRHIGRSTRDWRLRSAEKGARGQLRQAVTDWECLLKGTYNNEPFSYVRVVPKTGRTHQIRVHLKSLGRPIVGDKLYAGSQLERSNNLDISRLALHSFRLTLRLREGVVGEYEAPLPPEMDEAVSRIAE